jgi:hypothetical protein
VAEVDVGDDADLAEPVEGAVHGGPVNLGMADRDAVHDLVRGHVVLARQEGLDDRSP